MDIQKNINQLIAYGLNKDLIDPRDIDYIVNRLLEILKVDDFVYEKLDVLDENPVSILDNMLSYALSQNIIGNTIHEMDIFDTKIMDTITPTPSQVVDKFQVISKEDIKKATDYYYEFSKSTNYIRTERIKKDKRWKVDSPYGQIDITINLSKPEKDPKAIAAAKNMPNTNYPLCLLCKENVGFTGTAKHPARNNHRVIPIKLGNEDWFFQYSPYVYYNEHSIIIKNHHEPMEISELTFKRLLDFVELFPHYFIGSNADLPIVGGSILNHEHFQGGCYTFAMDNASVLKSYNLDNKTKMDVLNWPLTTLRLSSDSIGSLVNHATNILAKWRSYTHESFGIFSHTNGTPHNTITPIARCREIRSKKKYELDLVLRNNLTSDEHPLGIFHPHEHLHHIKKENIGLIEVMGLAILPPRLLTEMDIEKEADHIGQKFVEILECCGVYKLNQDGLVGLEKFIDTFMERD